MDPHTQAVPGYYVWQVPGQPVVVHLSLDIVDKLLAEVMRGFGAVPKRGAEVGGVLLGTIEKGSPSIVRVEDFEPVACHYKRGPSYLLTADDGAAFDEAAKRATDAVGYFRSHTRDGLSLAQEDIELIDQYFPAAEQIALLIKPFATKVSIASFFVREKGLFASTALLEFPFRRRELTGEEAPPRRTMLERVPRRREPRAEVQQVVREELAPEPVPAAPVPPYPNRPPVRSAPGGWGTPLSFIFLLVGVALGFLASLTMGPRSPGASEADYTLGLMVTKDGNNLSVKWNRDAAAVRSAQKGLLEIEDGKYTKPVDLDMAQLRNAGLLFTNSSKNVRFRLTVYPQDGVSVTQVMEWKGE